jgi:DNA polymerase elongation subunit (family B)
MRTHRKRLFFDIEVAPNIGLFWDAGYKKNISPESIIKERAIICICYKFEDDEEVQWLTWDKRQNDKAMLIDFIKVANTADEIVGHNGDKFDLAWIRTRCLFHGIPMFPKYVTVDTLKISRSMFKFNSNKLDYIAKFLNIGGKSHTEYSMWSDILLDNDRKQLDRMVDYCINDVAILEAVYKAMSNHIPPKTHFGMRFGGSKDNCPECGSDSLLKDGLTYLVSGSVKQRYQCKTCHKYFTANEKKNKN